ncbi:unnamed protein product [Larinioides sclopetarius]|uniref:Uncharacterized protein n=1 Tax=Larinioides sclopetarius TaxID=280406 RepID=A0AAV2BPW4_9ARAC
MALILYLKRNSESEDVLVGLLLEKCKDYTYSCELSILDVNGKVIVSKEERGLTSYGWALFRFDPLISKNKLIANKNLFLPNDTLVLRGSFEVCAGAISNELEYFTPNISSVVEKEGEVIDFHVAEAEADDSLEFEEYFVYEINQND